MSDLVLMFHAGVWVACAACAAYLASMLASARWHRFLIGTITLLWFRLLTWIALGGLVIAMLAEGIEALQQFLFWRH